MRIPTEFGERTKYFNDIQDEIPKYYFAFEGSQTEVQYFTGLIENRSFIGIRPLIEMIPLLRNFSYETNSHPERVIQYLSEHIENDGTVNSIVERTVDYICLNKKWSDAKTLCRNLKEFITKRYNLENEANKEELVEYILNYIENNYNIVAQIEDLSKYLDSQSVTFDKEIDCACVIIDRNIRNLDNYHGFVQKCKEKEYRLFVSNPDFELWLLMHSNNIFKYDNDTLLNNEKVNKNRRYLEQALSIEFKGYRKENIRFEKFLPFIQNAIENEKHFCEDIDELEYKLGTNIGILIKELKNMLD